MIYKGVWSKDWETKAHVGFLYELMHYFPNSEEEWQFVVRLSQETITTTWSQVVVGETESSQW